jgi:hypothetical protein
MPHRLRKITDVVIRVQRARSMATALKVAGLARLEKGEELHWPDLIHTLESILPTPEELGDALTDIDLEAPA